MIPKIFILGAGNVGAASAAAIAARRLGRVFLYDIVEDLAIGKAMDINHASPFFHTDSRVTGCNTLDQLDDADLVVITAGAPRRKGMTRADLLGENARVMDELGTEIMGRCPKARVLIVSNPVDTLTGYLKSKWPAMNVFGLGCSLDTVRLRFFLAEAAHASVDAVSALVIGTHDDNQVALVKHATIGGVGVDHLLDADTIGRVVQRTRQAGTAIVSRLKTRGSFYAASYTVAAIAEASIRDTRNVFPLSVQCTGEFGYEDICLALPAVVGTDGVQRVVPIDLTPDERDGLDVCAKSMRDAKQQINWPGQDA